MRRWRRLVLAVAVALAGDLAFIVVSGERSLLAPGSGPVGPWGFSLRAALLGLCLWLAGRVLLEPARRWNGGRLVIVLLLLPTLVQFQFEGGRLSGVDAISYYVFLRSAAKDGDFDLANEYAHYEMLERPDLSVPTKTGYRRSIYSVGPAVVWMPFFVAGEAAARLERVLWGTDVDLSGYGPHHRNAVALGSVLYGFLALLLIHAFLRRHFREGTALLATLLVWGTSFFHWYLVIQPLYAHNASTAAAALGLWLWDRDRGRRDLGGYLLLGLVLGLAMCVRWQNGVLLILPGLELLERLVRSRALGAVLAGGALMGLGVAIGVFPQMAAWKALYNMWLLPYPPQGTDFMRFDHPWILETLFSSRHGLLSWTPALWAGYLGFLPLLLRRRRLALTLLVPLVLMSYVNFCVGDWWGGASFSNRRFDSLLPVFAVGFAASLELATRWLRGNAGRGMALLLAPVLLWNLLLAEGVRRGLLPRDDTVSFSQLARAASGLLSQSVGFPTTWPASWLFAWAHDLPPSQYDRLVGRYLFYRQNSLGGRIELAAAEHAELLDENWARPETYDGRAARRARGDARVFAPLDVPEDLEIVVTAAAAAGDLPVVVQVNGREVGAFLARSDWNDEHLRAPAGFWRRELNEVRLVGARGLLVSEVRFVRLRLGR